MFYRRISKRKIDFLIFKPGARGQRPHASGFLKLLWFAHQYVCVSVCPPLRALITSGVIWCDIGRVRLVKQVLRLSPAFKGTVRCLQSCSSTHKDDVIYYVNVIVRVCDWGRLTLRKSLLL